MNCREWKSAFKKLYPGLAKMPTALQKLPPELAAHPALCRDCRLKFEALRLLHHGNVLTTPVPALLAARISARVGERIRAGQTPSYHVPRLLFPLTALFAIIALSFIIAPFFTPPGQTVTVQFILEAPAAQSVAVVGDWNRWDPAVDVLHDVNKDGIWEIELHLEKNSEYRYQFIINGESWIPDPSSALHVEDGFGGVNSVLEI